MVETRFAEQILDRTPAAVPFPRRKSAGIRPPQWACKRGESASLSGLTGTYYSCHCPKEAGHPRKRMMPRYQENCAHAHVFDRLRRIPRHLLHRGDAAGIFRRQPRAEISRLRGGAGAGAGAAWHHPARGGRRDRQALQCRRDRFRKAQNPDRAHRLSGAAGGAAARGVVPRWLGRMVPLGRDDPGHHRQRNRDADPRGAGLGRGGPQRHRRCARGAGAQIPRHADGRAQQPAAGGADHLRLQDGDRAGRLRAPQATPEGIARARPGRRVRRRRRHAVVARWPRARDPSRIDEGAQPRPAGDRLAHRARHHRRGRLLPRPRHRHLRQESHSTSS